MGVHRYVHITQKLEPLATCLFIITNHFFASWHSKRRSPGDRMSPCFSFVLPLQGKLFTSRPSSSSGTEIFISIFMDSNTHRGSPAFSTSPGLTAYVSNSPGTMVANS